MKSSKLFFSLLLVGFAVTSCHKDEPTVVDPNVPTPSCIELSGNQNDPLTLTNHIADPSVPDYCISGNYKVFSDVVIEPGVKILMRNGSNIYVLGSGSLNSTGTETEKIKFIGENSLIAGQWEGIRFATNSPNNQLVYTDVSGGGDNSTYPSMVFLHFNGTLNIDHSLFFLSSSNGFVAESASSNLTGISNTIISLCSLYPLSITSRQLGSIGDNISGDANNENKILLRTEQLQEATTIRKTGFSYFLSGVQSIAADVTVEAGASFFMDSDSRIIIEGSGSFNCVGTSTNKIIFRGNEPTPGYWGYIRTYPSTNPLNRFEYCEFAYGGNSSTYPGMLFLTNNSYARVGNSEFIESERWGIFNNNNSGNLVNDGNNTFTNNALGGIGIN